MISLLVFKVICNEIVSIFIVFHGLNLTQDTEAELCFHQTLLEDLDFIK